MQNKNRADQNSPMKYTHKHLRTKLMRHLPLAMLLLTLASCNVEKEIIYFQDRGEADKITVQPLQTIRVRPADKIAIIVKCEDPEASSLFNQFTINQIMGTTQRVTATGSNGIVGYTVDANGDIDFPVLGKLHVTDMTRQEIADLVKNELEKQGQARNASVTVEFVDLGVTVLGEVKAPGRKNIMRDTYTVLDAIADAGDLTIDAKRDHLMVTRMQGDSVKNFQLDLKDQRSLMSSPAFYLQQNDIVYVEPSAKRARTATVNGNTILSASFWVSIASLLATLASLVIRNK